MAEANSRPHTLLEASTAIRHGDITPLELVGDCLARINSFDSQVSAWVLVDPAGALQAAERLTRELADGRYRGPLHGIPLGIKDVADVSGMPTRAGSTLTESRAATEDATTVERLRAAGAIILGKTVTTEFASFDPSPTHNPWNLAHTPGGSSSGSAAAVSMAMCLGALGSQTGGSITRPASYCGVAGLKPTFGRVSRAGVVPQAFHLDHVGVLARTAADCGLLLDPITGDDPRDPAIAVREPLQRAATADTLQAPRLGVIWPYFFEQEDAEVARLTRQTIEALAEQGAQLIELSLPMGFSQAHVMHRRLMAGEAADFHRARYGAPCKGYGPKIASLIAEGLALSMREYQEALRHQAMFRGAVARTMIGIDALLTPSTHTPAGGMETTGEPRFQSPWSHAGVPTVTIPCALTAAGLPLGLQLIGRAWSEERLVAVATWCEERIGFTALPPLLR